MTKKQFYKAYHTKSKKVFDLKKVVAEKQNIEEEISKINKNKCSCAVTTKNVFIAGLCLLAISVPFAFIPSMIPSFVCILLSSLGYLGYGVSRKLTLDTEFIKKLQPLQEELKIIEEKETNLNNKITECNNIITAYMQQPVNTSAHKSYTTYLNNDNEIEFEL